MLLRPLSPLPGSAPLVLLCGSVSMCSVRGSASPALLSSPVAMPVCICNLVEKCRNAVDGEMREYVSY